MCVAVRRRSAQSAPAWYDTDAFGVFLFAATEAVLAMCRSVHLKRPNHVSGADVLCRDGVWRVKLTSKA